MAEQNGNVGKRGLTNEDLWRVKSVTDFDLSPDGTQVAYVVSSMKEDDDSLHSAIWVVDRETGDKRQLTSGDAMDMQPAWSPDGSKLAFVSTRAEKPQIFLLDLRGGDPRKLTDAERGARFPTWSPDGKRIAYLSGVEREDHKIASETAWLDDHKAVADKKGPKLRRVSALKERFDGRGFIEDTAHIFVIDAEGGEPKQLTDGPHEASLPVWSPDGREIAFFCDRGEDSEHRWSTALWSADAESGELRRLTRDTFGPFAHGASWSPDGKRLAFYSGSDISQAPFTEPHLCIVPREGGDERDLTKDLDRPSASMVGTDHAFAGMTPPAWSADGNTIFFPVGDHGNHAIYAIDVSSGATRQVSFGDHMAGGAQLTPDGSMLVFIATTPDRPLDLHAVPVSGGAPTPLTNTSSDLMDAVTCSAPENFQFKGPGDLDVEGWLIPPLNVEPGAKYPMVLFIHGGPWGAYGNAFYLQKQALATAGIASLYINPRGSTGYGQAFADGADFGLDDFKDLMAGVDAAIERFDVDPDRMGVTGISYGGFMTNWVVGHTDRFAAAVSENGISNWISFFGTADIGALWFNRQLGGPFWESREMLERFLFHSPISYVQNITTPLLLVQGESDYRCPIEQAEQLLSALRIRRQTVEMVRFPGASHGIVMSAPPHQRIEHWGVPQRWFERYLMPEKAQQVEVEAPSPQLVAETVPTS